MKKVSIITINLNNKTGLEKTIKSVISQTSHNYEFIVIDGASTDGSTDVMKLYAEHITYSLSEPDKGIYEAMNKGIKAAKGEYLHFLNSGDIYASDTVLENAFKEDWHDSFVCGNFFYDFSGELVKYGIYKNRDWTFSLYDIFSDGLCHQAFFINRKMFDKYGYYDEKLRIASDFKLFFIAIGLHHEPVRYVDVDIVIYDTEGFSSNVGGKAILREKQLIAQQELSEQVFNKINYLHYLQRNAYITEFTLSKKWIHFLFKVFNKICTTLKLTKIKESNPKVD
ncbi:glycosyltransferase family 2 protein [Dysgonomonas sp. 520]|uniref:glycosyltransferase family 2 protein n=1 Tax=Dysgonomonas sp. 520 TaxID=2302931 RepID=UPI0013D38842|nr:glycosyltransferase family 2 protein [Dysgonomonas sp. 520]NDW10779.1 glycosyltransferase [Dysgonomonas sp. 520]